MFAPELATLAKRSGPGPASHPSSEVNSWIASTATPPRVQTPLVTATAGPSLGAPPPPEPAKKNRISLTFLRRRGSTTSHTQKLSKQAPKLAPTAEDPGDIMAAVVGIGTGDTLDKRDTVNGHSTHAQKSSTDGSSDRPLTQVSDNSHGEDSILNKVGSGMGSMKKRFSFAALPGMGRKPSKSSVKGGRSGSESSDAFAEE